jgi:uridylate kinase
VSLIVDVSRQTSTVTVVAGGGNVIRRSLLVEIEKSRSTNEYLIYRVNTATSSTSRQVTDICSMRDFKNVKLLVFKS